MRPSLKLSLVFIITGSAFLHAQKASHKSPRIRLALVIPYASPVAGAPYMAEYAIHVQKPLADGILTTWHSETLVARDSDGRIRHELHDYVSDSFTKEPPPLLVVLLDPVARLTHTLDPVLRIDDRRWLNAPHLSHYDFGSSSGEDLGVKTIFGISVRGVRLRSIIPPRRGSSGVPDRVVDDIWYSNELQLVVFEQQTDSAGLQLTISMSKLDRHEPDASLFKAPRGYHLPSANQVAAGIGTWHLPSTNQVTAGIGLWSVASPDQTPNISGVW